MALLAVAAPAVAPHFLWRDRKLRAANKGAGGRKFRCRVRPGQRGDENHDHDSRWVGGGPHLYPFSHHASGSINPSILHIPLVQAPQQPLYHDERRGVGRAEGSRLLSGR